MTLIFELDTHTYTYVYIVNHLCACTTIDSRLRSLKVFKRCFNKDKQASDNEHIILNTIRTAILTDFVENMTHIVVKSRFISYFFHALLYSIVQSYSNLVPGPNSIYQPSIYQFEF